MPLTKRWRPLFFVLVGACALQPAVVQPPRSAADEASAAAGDDAESPGAIAEVTSTLRAGGANWAREPDPLRPLSRTEEDGLWEAVSSLPLVSGYPYSGCQNRAFGVWSALDSSVRDRVKKLWLVAPGGYWSPSASKIGLVSSPIPPVSWSFHVVLVYSSHDGEARIVDPALSPRAALTPEEWMALLTGTDGALAEVSDGAAFGYFSAYAVKTGDFFRYEGLSAEQEWASRGLATDAVGSMLLDGLECAALNPTSANEMSCALTRWSCDLPYAGQSSVGLPTGCQEALSTFDEKRASWRGILGEEGDAWCPPANWTGCSAPT